MITGLIAFAIFAIGLTIGIFIGVWIGKQELPYEDEL